MAKTTAPLMSLDASGSIAGALTFSKWKGRNYVRQLVVPSNPNTVKQQSVRAMMAFLSQQWAGLGATPKGTWENYASSLSISPFNAYTKINQTRWGNFLTPGQSYPVTDTGTAGTLATQTATGGVGQVSLAVALTAVNNNWGLAIYRSTTTGFTPSFSNLVKAVKKTTTTSETFVDTPLDPGTYYYRIRPFTTDGVQGTAFAEINATVT